MTNDPDPDADPEVERRIALLREAKLRSLTTDRPEIIPGEELDRLMPKGPKQLNFVQKKEQKLMSATNGTAPVNGHVFVGAGGRRTPVEKACPKCGEPCNKANGRCYACVPCTGPRPRNKADEPGKAAIAPAAVPAPCVPVAAAPEATDSAPASTPRPVARATTAEPPAIDREVLAISSVVAALAGLDADARRRVLIYATTRFSEAR